MNLGELHLQLHTPPRGGLGVGQGWVERFQPTPLEPQ